jgi:branched-chain amino acid transport system substrate-binding protein
LSPPAAGEGKIKEVASLGKKGKNERFVVRDPRPGGTLFYLRGALHRLPWLGVALGCGPSGDPPVIAVAFQGQGQAAVAVAREELAERGLAVRLLFDSAVAGDPADVDVARALELVAIPGIVAVVGHGNSRASLSAAPVYNEAAIPQVVPTSTSRRLATAGEWTFTLAPNDSVEGAFIGDFVIGTLGGRAVTIFYVNDEYGTGLRDGVRARLLEGRVRVLDEVSVDPRSDFPTVIEASLRLGTPDVVVVAARWIETGAIARLLRARVPGIRVVAGDGAVLMPELTQHVGDAAPVVYVVNFWLPDARDSTSRAFVERYRRVVGGDPPGPLAMTHDAIMVLAAAIGAVGVDRDAIRRYLHSLGRERPPHSGVTGPISFQPGRPGNFIMTRLEGGRLVRVVQ